jgi:hypothetical protein
MLKKPNFDNEQKYKNELSFHTHAVDVVISDRDFYRHGWELSKTDIISFGKYFEYKAKLLMRAIVSNYISFGIAKNVAIIKFQNNFMMEEEYWPFESIKKDFQRYENSNNIDCHNYAFHHLDRLVLLNLSNAGFITNSIVRIHEKRLIESE